MDYILCKVLLIIFVKNATTGNMDWNVTKPAVTVVTQNNVIT